MAAGSEPNSQPLADAKPVLEGNTSSTKPIPNQNPSVDALSMNPPISETLHKPATQAVSPAQPSINTTQSILSTAMDPTQRTPWTPSYRDSLGAGSGPPSPSLSVWSTRPAPPSPATSRRASQAGSASGGSSSRRNSRRTSGLANLVFSGITRESMRANRLSQSASVASNRDSSGAPASYTAQTPSNRPGTRVSTSSFIQRILTIKIRDFAFFSSDDKHFGLGPDVPRTNRPRYLLRVLNSHLRNSAISTASSVFTEDEDVEEEDDDYEQLYHFVGLNLPQPPAGDVDEDDDFDDEPPPLYPGTYRALYEFTPEDPSEKALDVGEQVRVLGRGGGNGWAVVLVEEGDDAAPAHDTGSDPEQKQDVGKKTKQALVPESYLELVAVDPEYEELLREYLKAHPQERLVEEEA